MNEPLAKISIDSCEPEGYVKYFTLSQDGQDYLRSYAELFDFGPQISHSLRLYSLVPVGHRTFRPFMMLHQKRLERPVFVKLTHYFPEFFSILPIFS